MRLARLLLLTVEAIACGIPLFAGKALVGLLEVWQASIYRRIDRIVVRAR